MAEDQQLWRALTLQRFPVPLRSSPPQPGGWKGLYKCVRGAHSLTRLGKCVRPTLRSPRVAAVPSARFNHQVVRGVLLHKDLQKQLDAAYPRLWHAGVHA